MTPEWIARRHALGIPVHLEDADHQYRADGYCNCGARDPEWKPLRAPIPRRQRRGIVGLDVIEGNPGGDRA